jgi:HlyD family secretion protein
VAELDLAHTVIRAPIDGVVISRSIDVGQTGAASLQAPKLFVSANWLARMHVETKIDESDIGRIHPGLPVTFSVDAFPDNTFNGTVSQVRLEPITEQNVVTYTTVMRTENPDLRLRPGMTANVSVQVARRDEVLRIPAAALRFHPPMPAGKGGRAGARGDGGDGGGARADVAPSGGGRRGQGSAMGAAGGGAGSGGGAPDSARAARWRNHGGGAGAMGGGAPGGAMAGASGAEPRGAADRSPDARCAACGKARRTRAKR